MHCKSSVNRFNNLLLSGGCDVGICFICFFFIRFKNSLYLPGKVRIGVARPVSLPEDDEEYEESPPDTARYNGESLLQSPIRLTQGKREF